jgi:hypothetical protein
VSATAVVAICSHSDPVRDCICSHSNAVNVCICSQTDLVRDCICSARESVLSRICGRFICRLPRQSSAALSDLAGQTWSYFELINDQCDKIRAVSEGQRRRCALFKDLRSLLPEFALTKGSEKVGFESQP